MTGSLCWGDHDRVVGHWPLVVIITHVRRYGSRMSDLWQPNAESAASRYSHCHCGLSIGIFIVRSRNQPHVDDTCRQARQLSTPIRGKRVKTTHRVGNSKERFNLYKDECRADVICDMLAALSEAAL